MTGVMGEFRNEAIRRLFIGLGILVGRYLGFVMMPGLPARSVLRSCCTESLATFGNR